MTIPPPITPKVFKTYELVRLVSAVFLLGIVGMLYFHMRQASSWAWLIKDKDTEAAVQGTEKPWEETIVPHDGSEDPEQKQEAAYEAQALSDNQDVLSEEMPLYWRMLRWSLSEKFADLKARSTKKVAFTHLFKNPEKHRGELISLRMHVNMVRLHKPERNAIDLQEVYEAWGGTDGSGTNPYVVIFADKPPQLPVGDTLQEEIRFVGYFFKNFGYETKVEKHWKAPMLIGRVEYIPDITKVVARDEKVAKKWIFLGMALVIAMVFLVQYVGVGKVKLPYSSETSQAREEENVGRFLDEVDSPPRDEPVTSTPVKVAAAVEFPDVLQLDTEGSRKLN